MEENFIFRIDVRTFNLKDKEESKLLFPEEIDLKEFELYFASFDEMSLKIDEITKGYSQYWADVTSDSRGQNVEHLEYHNGEKKWDKEIKIKTSRLYLSNSLIETIQQVLAVNNPSR